MYDLAIIGAGWAGFNAALKAKELRLKVCLIESDKIGGTCLNRGCIPTKTLIASAKAFLLTKKSSVFGIELKNPRFNFVKIQARKNIIINQLTQAMQSRISGIDFIKSSALIRSPNEIKIDARLISTKSILMATGSSPSQLPQLKFDREKIISSDQALELSEIPSSLLIVGGGVIGCEFASLFSILGSQVTIAEKMTNLLPGEDKDVARKIEIIFKKRGIQVITGADVNVPDMKNYSRVLVCVGRTPNTAGLGLEGLGIKLDKNRIAVDDYLKTNLANIYAAGDCASKLMLAHYAAYQGKVAVENIVSNNTQRADNLVVPACIFTEPQISSVGLNEENAVSLGISVEIHKFDFRASGAAWIIDETEGFIKIVTNRQTQEVIGASIIGPSASELIAILAMAISVHLTAHQIREIIFAHPTLAESIHDVF
ncbi:MAG: dihydrolipoyl dehydrogenase [Candidatus Omnitrophica bacterium CG11_big_fil_rev_8_21_14_0_20_41_12]|nr:MAG: dihydrolipoyl dehydrogenase [Candidatus Omnitrophica bacterium CG11_big_fil_rev_8_21_14_0_20_41_12]